MRLKRQINLTKFG